MTEMKREIVFWDDFLYVVTKNGRKEDDRMKKSLRKSRKGTKEEKVVLYEGVGCGIGGGGISGSCTTMQFGGCDIILCSVFPNCVR